MQTRPRLARQGSRVLSGQELRFLFGVLFGAQAALAGQIAGPLVASANSNYFQDANGAVLILGGSQTWNALQDWGSNGSVLAPV
jgi:hypothetical protein